MRLTNYLCQQAALTPGRKPYPIRLTPGQYKELCKEQGTQVDVFKTDLGYHPVQLTYDGTIKAPGDNVILCPREDLFSETERDTGIELISLANSVTSVADNIACCEIVSVGPLVNNVKVGDLAFIDFYDVKQGAVIENDELFIAGADAFKALFDVNTQEIIPLDNYVITRRNTKRFQNALIGTDRFDVPSHILTDGIPGGKNSVGLTTAHILYQEVVRCGRLTTRPRPGVMTKAETKLLDVVTSFSGYTAEEVALYIAQVRHEREFGREPDVQPGDLVAFTKELGTPIRVKGEFCYLIHHDNVLGIIDDEHIIDNAVRAGRAGKLVRI